MGEAIHLNKKLTRPELDALWDKPVPENTTKSYDPIEFCKKYLYQRDGREIE